MRLEVKLRKALTYIHDHFQRLAARLYCAGGLQDHIIERPKLAHAFQTKKFVASPFRSVLSTLNFGLTACSL